MVKEKYRKIGIKLTPQRVAILDYLENKKGHPCAEEIFRHVSKVYPTMSLATVYNTQETLKTKGSISEITIDPCRKRYDHDTKPHHHLICVKCRKILDIHREYDINVPDEEQKGFQVVGNHIEFYGLCSECKKKRN